MTSITRPLLYASLLGASLIFAGCGEADKAEPTKAAAPADPNLVAAGENLTRIIQLGEVTSVELSDMLRVAGQVDFDEQRITRIGATVTGRISELQAMLGQQVKVGQTLAVLNSTELGAAQLAYMKARAQAQLNQRSVDRARQLQMEERARIHRTRFIGDGLLPFARTRRHDRSRELADGGAESAEELPDDELTVQGPREEPRRVVTVVQADEIQTIDGVRRGIRCRDGRPPGETSIHSMYLDRLQFSLIFNDY